VGQNGTNAVEAFVVGEGGGTDGGWVAGYKGGEKEKKGMCVGKWGAKNFRLSQGLRHGKSKDTSEWRAEGGGAKHSAAGARVFGKNFAMFLFFLSSGRG
jgi:hypothetical protein